MEAACLRYLGLATDHFHVSRTYLFFGLCKDPKAEYIPSRFQLPAWPRHSSAVRYSFRSS